MNQLSSEAQQLLARERARFERERARIAARLHDDVSQGLTVLTMEMAHWLEMERSGRPEKEHLVHMLSLLDKVNKVVRDVSTELHPRILEEFGLVAGLQFECRRLEAASVLKLASKLNLPVIECSKSMAVEIFRLFQMLVSLSARSGNAEVLVDILVNQGGLVVSLEGTDHELVSAGSIDWRIAVERAVFIGGTLRSGSTPSGNILLLKIPMDGNHIKTPPGHASAHNE